MPRATKFPFTADDIAISKREARDQFPHADAVMIDYLVASEVIINILGYPWWEDRLADGRERYFLKEREDDPGRFIHQHRVVGLGRALLACQERPGFVDQLDGYRTRDLIGVFHELYTARLLLDNGHGVDFVVARGTKGLDYDLLVDDTVAFEVKAFEDDAVYSESSLTSKLRDARKQLPDAGPGAVALRLPDAWATHAAFGRDADRIFQGAVRNSGRLNALVVVWDEWFPLVPTGAALVMRFRSYYNSAPHSPIEMEPLVAAMTEESVVASLRTDRGATMF